MPPQADRTSRQANYNGIGDVGRITGVLPPKNVPRDSAGNEKPAAFFAAATGEEARNSIGSRRSTGQSPARGGGAAGDKDKRKKRTDNFHEIGERGRITGVRVPPVAIDPSTGYEDVGKFFASSPNATSVAGASSRKKKVSPPKKQQQQQYEEDPYAGHDFGGGDEDEDEDEMGMGNSMTDMDVDDGSSLTPSSYQSRQKAKSSTKNPVLKRLHNNRPAQPSPLSKSSRQKSTAVDESDESDDDDEEDAEEVRKVMVGGSKKGLSMLSHGQGRGAAESDSEDEDDVVIDSPAARRKASQSSRRTSGGSSSPNKLTNGSGKKVDKKGKGRAKSPTPEPEPEMEQYEEGSEEEQYGMEDIEEEDEEEDSEEPRVAKATSSKKPAASKKKKPTTTSASASNSKKRTREMSSVDEDGVRRSSRQRLQPLEYWRNERVIYKRRTSGLGIDQVVRIKKTAPESLSKAGSKKGARGGGGGGGGHRVKSEVPEEEGVDDMTDPDGLVWSWEGNSETMRRIAFTAKMMDPRPTHNNKFMFQKIYTELDYLAGGILQIPAGAEKPPKPAKDNSYMFYCIEGAVSVVVHRTRFSIGPGATFFVPRGNTYAITATSNRDVKLFFTQGRRVIEAADGSSRPDVAEEPEAEEEEEEEEGEEGEEQESEEEE